MKATYRDHGGTDLSVVNAARVSFSQHSYWDYVGPMKVQTLKEKDVNLIQYLARGMPRKEWEQIIHTIIQEGHEHNSDMVSSGTKTYLYNEIQWRIEDLMLMAQHWVPFTHTMVTLHMIAPVPIARQCFKHKIGFTESEESRRYITTTPTLYIPEEFRAKAKDVKQGSAGKHDLSDFWKGNYLAICRTAIETYDKMIADGVAPEQARFILPQGCEVEWIWTGNIASYARYVNQRSDPHAQLESQELAKQVSDIIRPLFPVSWDALVKSGRTE